MCDYECTWLLCRMYNSWAAKHYWGVHSYHTIFFYDNWGPILSFRMLIEATFRKLTQIKQCHCGHCPLDKLDMVKKMFCLKTRPRLVDRFMTQFWMCDPLQLLLYLLTIVWNESFCTVCTVWYSLQTPHIGECPHFLVSLQISFRNMFALQT